MWKLISLNKRKGKSVKKCSCKEQMDAETSCENMTWLVTSHNYLGISE